jgi:hypothetical protein
VQGPFRAGPLKQLNEPGEVISGGSADNHVAGMCTADDHFSGGDTGEAATGELNTDRRGGLVDDSAKAATVVLVPARLTVVLKTT